MEIHHRNISAFICAAVLLTAFSSAEAITSLRGEAELSYTDYNATWGKSAVSDNGHLNGDSFTQKYSLNWMSTNHQYSFQPRYYGIELGYDWLNFRTKETGDNINTNIGDTFGLFRMSGELGYSSAELPISFRAFRNDTNPPNFRRLSGLNGLIPDNLVSNIDGKLINSNMGVSFIFNPADAKSLSLRELPRLQVDYNESMAKSAPGNADQINQKISQLSVAGLSKGDNWLHYRFYKIDDYLDSNRNSFEQQFQIGLIDYLGHRKWSSLTNWINVSADGRLTTLHGSSNREEYDVNFMAIATRRTWSARTFMNYNRSMTTTGTDSNIEEIAKVPVYIKGLYGADTDWYANVSTEQGRQVVYGSTMSTSKESTNTLAVGGTTFSRSKFTLSPSITVRTNRTYAGVDSSDLGAFLETNSTARFSNKLALAAKASFNYSDNGNNNATSTTWHSALDMRANYRGDNRLTYTLSGKLGTGEDAGSNNTVMSTLSRYVESTAAASVSWVASSVLSTSLEARQYNKKYATAPAQSEADARYRLILEKNIVSFKSETSYTESSDGVIPKRSRFIHNGDFQYRPDRYSDSSLRYSYEKNIDNMTDNTKYELVQKYSYKFFSRTGLNRNIATISQEFSNTREEGYGYRIDSRYLMLTGRYSPTEKISLMGSAKYANENGTSVMFYNASVNADFKLLSSSLDYSYARRDSDKRIEKRVAATVKRVF